MNEISEIIGTLSAISNDSVLAEATANIASFLFKVSFRNKTVESKNVVVQYSSTTDVVSNQPIKILKSAQKGSNSSNKLTVGLENMSNKVEMNENIFTQSFTNFNLLSRIINNSSKNLNDYGISSLGINFN